MVKRLTEKTFRLLEAYVDAGMRGDNYRDGWTALNEIGAILREIRLRQPDHAHRPFARNYVVAHDIATGRQVPIHNSNEIVTDVLELD